MKFFLLFIIFCTSCAFDPLGMEYHETSQNKKLRLHNEEVMREYWIKKHINPDLK
jgi:hypothetical protein